MAFCGYEIFVQNHLTIYREKGRYIILEKLFGRKLQRNQVSQTVKSTDFPPFILLYLELTTKRLVFMELIPLGLFILFGLTLTMKFGLLNLNILKHKQALY